MPVFRFQRGAFTDPRLVPTGSPEILAWDLNAVSKSSDSAVTTPGGMLAKEFHHECAWATSFNVEYPSFSGVRILDKAFPGNCDS